MKQFVLLKVLPTITKRMKEEIRNTPIVVANTQWDLPETLVKDVKAERMINSLLNLAGVKMDYKDLVGDAEVVAYLMPATSASVIRNDVAEIYLYCVRRMMEKRGAKDIDFLDNNKELSEYQMTKLNELKKFIFDSRGGKESNPVINALQEVFFKDIT